MKKKQLIRLTESDLHRIIKETVNNILEDKDYLFFYDDDDDNYYINAKEKYSDNSDEYTHYYPHVDVDMNFTPRSYLTNREWEDRFLDKAY
jgi:hypothetical protein